MKEGWEIKELQDCLSYIKNGANIKQKKGASGIPITRIETLSGGQFHRDKLGYADVYELGKFAPYVLDDADILMSHINSKAYIGRSVIYHKQGDEQIIHGMNLLRLKFFPDMINPEFANYYFKCTFFLSEVAKIRKDAVNQSSMAISDLKRIAIPVPPLSEQQHIVEELDLLSSIIEKKKAQLNELDNLAQSLFYEMFGDPISNEKGWEVKKLGKLFITSSGGTPSKTHKEYYEGGNIPWLRSGEVAQGYIYNTEMYITEEGLNNSSAKYFPINTVVVAMYGATVGQVGILKSRMTTNQAICGIFPSESFVPTFLMFFLKGMKPVYLKDAAGGAQPNISQGVIKNTLVPIVSIALQQQFASKIEAIEHQKELIKQSIKEVETLFNSRMDYYFN